MLLHEEPFLLFYLSAQLFLSRHIGHIFGREKLVATVSEMLAQPGKLAEMGQNARKLSVDDSLDRIASALLKLVKTP